jgi:hypothetical protein
VKRKNEMARALNKLTARTVAGLSAPGRYSDGGGLYLFIDPNKAKRWTFMYRWGKHPLTGRSQQHEMGLGPVNTVSLAQARDEAEQARRKLRQGIDPIGEKREQRATAQAERAKAITFGTFAASFIGDHEGGWESAKHCQQWRNTLRDYTTTLSNMKLDEIGVEHVLAVLRPIWQAKPATASSLRGRIERVLDSARAQGLWQGENPARWRGTLDAILPVPQRLTHGHHCAGGPSRWRGHPPWLWQACPQPFCESEPLTYLAAAHGSRPSFLVGCLRAAVAAWEIHDARGRYPKG